MNCNGILTESSEEKYKNCMSTQLDYILAEIGKQNPIHGKKLRKTLTGLNEVYLERANMILAKYETLLKKHNKDINYGITCYLKMIDDIMYETVQFIQTGKYTSTSFEEVNNRVYGNPEIMEYYMHGILMSQFLWKHHYQVFDFFTNTFPSYAPNIKNYLEIGGGHGLFVSQALKSLSPNARVDLVDISESSLGIANIMINNNRVNYILKDIFDFNNENTYDFITMGEVLEHVEDPLSLLKRLKVLLRNGGTAYITTPTNGPTIDHIYLFNNIQEIRDLIHESGFTIKNEKIFETEDKSIEESEKEKIALLYAAFLQ